MFVSYAHENADWLRVLAANLHQSGLGVFFDEWYITGGVRLLQEGWSDTDLDAAVLDGRGRRHDSIPPPSLFPISPRC